MKRTLAILTAFVASTAIMHARQLSPAESLQRFAANQPALHKVLAPVASGQGKTAETMELEYTSAIAGGNAFYVFQHPQREGFVILGADDLVPDVLGYCEEGSFDAAHLPEGFAYWMDDLNRQIALAVKAGVPLYSSTSNGIQRASVTPLLTCIWGQGDQYSPFYDDCPSYQGEKCVAGCVATAMAQVMYAHKHPSRGQGSISYTTATLKFSQSVNFNTTYSWNSMLDAYGYTYKDNAAEGYDHHEYTTTQGAAVAKLMHHCGASVYMDYNVSSAGGSGTLSHYVMPALYKYFKYDAGGRFCQRDYYTDDNWENLVYSEIAAGRPVFYSGATSTSGHAFVLDGYRNGYFHVNWGWENLCNGYYALTGTDPLHPSVQGTGGSVTDEGFKYNQDCIAGLRPAVAGSQVVPNFFLQGDSYIVTDDKQKSIDHLDADAFYILTTGNGLIYSVTNEKINACLAVKFVDCTSGAVHYSLIYDEESDELDVLNGLRGYYFRTDGVPAGQYRVYPVVRTKDRTDWTDVFLPVGISVPQVVVGDFTPAPSQPDAELACSAFTLNKAETHGRFVNAAVSHVLNVSSAKSDFFGDVAIGIYDKNDDLVDVLTDGKYTVPESSPLGHYRYFTDSITLTGTVPTGLADGEYALSPVAFQKDSEKWKCLGTFDVEAKTYDLKSFQDIAMSVRNGQVLIDGAETDPGEDFSLYVADDVTFSGSSLVLPIRLRNPEAICGLQFDVTLSSGVTYRKSNGREDVTLSTQRTTAAKTDVLDFEKQANGAMRVVACSTAGTAFSGKDGEIVLLHLNVTTTRQKTGFSVKLSNIVLTDSKAKAYTVPDFNTKILPDIAEGIDNVQPDARADAEIYNLNGTHSRLSRGNTGVDGGFLIIKREKDVRKAIENK